MLSKYVMVVTNMLQMKMPIFQFFYKNLICTYKVYKLFKEPKNRKVS